jgi:hypothetical protein
MLLHTSPVEDATMDLINRALSFARRKEQTAETHGTLGEALPSGVVRPRAAIGVPVIPLRTFLLRRLPTAERAFEAQGDLVAYAEMRLCRQLLKTPLDEKGLIDDLYRRRGDVDQYARAAAISLWAGWRSAGGRPPVAGSTSGIRPAVPAARPASGIRPSVPGIHAVQPRHNTNHRSSQYRVSDILAQADNSQLG